MPSSPTRRASAARESRPAGEPWSYRFFIELEDAADAPSVREALAAAREGASVRVLGSYPRWSA